MNENQTAPNMDFDERVENGENFENDCKLYCSETSDFVTRNGYEFTHPELKKLINSDPSIEARLIRYMPDFIMIKKTGAIVQVECKASMLIEQDAYDIYKKFHSIGYRILIFAIDNKSNEMVYCQYIQKIKFRKSIGENNSVGSRKPFLIMDYNSMIEVSRFYEIVNARKAQNEVV